MPESILDIIKQLKFWTDHRQPTIHTNPHDHFPTPNLTGGTMKRGDHVQFEIIIE